MKLDGERTLEGRFPPYEILDHLASDTRERTRKLERLYHQTQAQSWDPKKVLDELEKKHGGIHLPPDKAEAVGHLFTVLLWGELAAWNIAADLARHLPDAEAKMAATGQVFDEARHFTVLRDYLSRAGVVLPELNPYGRRVLVKILETGSLLQKLYGMQLLVENMALAIFRRLADSRVEPVLTDLLTYVERDESRHVALGVLYLPRLLARTTPLDRARNWVFNLELFLLTIAGGQLLDPHFQVMGVDHRELGLTTMRLHQQVIRQMGDELGLPKGTSPKGVYGLTSKQHALLNDFLHPERPQEMTSGHKLALSTFDRAVHAAARFVS
jgi:hypothetical protein